MIRAVYHRKYHRLTVVGHAYSGDAGHDLVCAGVSTLVHTLAANIRSWNDAGHVKHPSIVLEKGEAELSCEFPRRYNAQLTLVMDAICGGLEILAKSYPEHISYEMRG